MKKILVEGEKCDKCGTMLEREQYIELCDWCGEEVTDSLHVVLFFEHCSSSVKEVKDEDFYFHSWKCVGDV